MKSDRGFHFLPSLTATNRVRRGRLVAVKAYFASRWADRQQNEEQHAIFARDARRRGNRRPETSNDKGWVGTAKVNSVINGGPGTHYWFDIVSVTEREI